MSGERAGWWVLAFFVLVYLVPLGWRPLLLPDEFRYAEIPREMLASGDWVVPRIAGYDYFEKPALGYWLTAVSEAVLGLNRFAVRLPAALSTGLTALLVALLFGARRGERFGPLAWLAALVYLSFLLSVVLGIVALLDAPLTLFSTATLVAFFLASAAPRGSPRERGLLLAAGVACGLAFLTKGFLALALPCLVAGGYLVWQRRWRDLGRMPWIPAAAAALVAAPWSVAVHLRAPDFWSFFFWHEHVQRFFGHDQAQHPQPWWFLIALTPVVALPWTAFAPAAARGFRAGGPPAALRGLVRYCVVWVVAAYVFFSLSSGKLVSYILPALPALAALVAIGLWQASESAGADRWWRRGGLAGGALFALVAAGCAVVLLRAGPDSKLMPTWHYWAFVAALVVLAGLSAAAALARGPRRLLIAAAIPIPLILTVQGAVPDRVLNSKAPGAFLARHRADVTPETLILTDDNGFRAVCWAFERDDVRIVGWPGELEYGLEHAPPERRGLSVAEARGLIETHEGAVAMFVERNHWLDWKTHLPPPRAVDETGHGRFLFVTW